MVSFTTDANGNTVVAYIAVTLGSNGGTGFQQQVVVDPNTNSSYYASNLKNVSFQDGAGNKLKSWQETHAATNTSTSVIYWVVMPATITVVYLCLVGTSLSSIDGTYQGVEPKSALGTYGQYDNGSGVFTKYYNWSGTSRPADWTAANGVATYNNGITLISGQRVITSASYDYTTHVRENYAFANAYETAGNDDVCGYSDNATNTQGISTDSATSKYCTNSATNNTDISAGSTAAPQVNSIWTNSGKTLTYGQINYASAVSTTYFSMTNPFPMDICSTTATIFSQWDRLRLIAPSNNTMPTQSFSGLVNLGFASVMMVLG